MQKRLSDRVADDILTMIVIVVGTIRNVGRGSCYALYFCGKLEMEVV